MRVGLVLTTSLGIAVACLAVGLVVPAFGQQSGSRSVGIPDDWSHHHLVFSNPGTPEQAMQNGGYERWLRIVNDPRFLLQQTKRYAGQHPRRLNSPFLPTAPAESSRQDIMPGGASTVGNIRGLHSDWSMDAGAVPSSIDYAEYPAKFSFSINQAFCDSDPTPDFVVDYTADEGTAAVPATGTITFSTQPSRSNTAYIQIESIHYFFTSTGSVAAPASAGECNVSAPSESGAETNLFDAITSPSSGTASTYLCNGATNSAVTSVTNVAPVISMSGTNGNFTLVKIGTVSGVALSGGLGGTNGQATVIAYDNLYSSCSGLSPLIYWQYNAGGTVFNSVSLSLDGTQVAFVQNAGTGGSGAASLAINHAKETESANASIGCSIDSSWRGRAKDAITR